MYVAAFGKHPGWNDHIDDIGLETDRLVLLKRVLYVEGIGATIDSGGWEKLGEGQHLEGFSHVIVWRTGEDLVVARMWSSRDGKGRTKYPMVVCVQVRGVGVERALRRVLPVLERAERACREAADAQSVRGVLDGVRSELRTAMGAGAAPDEADLTVPASAIAAAAASPAFAGQPDGPARILYQIEREMAPYLAFGAGGRSKLGTASHAGKSRMVEVRPQQVRVPALADGAEENSLAWLRFMLALLDPMTPLMVVVPLGQAWTDVLVGQPVGTQFYCLRATPKALPLTSDIPYTLDGPFAETARKLTAGPLESGDIVVRRQAARAAAGPAAAPKLGWLRGPRVMLLVLAGLIPLGVLVALLVMWLSPEVPRAGPKTETAAAPAPAAPTGTNGGSVEGGVGEAGKWGELCAAYRDWVGLLVRELDGPAGAALLRDPHLGPKLACLRDSARPVDPWSIAGVDRGYSLAAMTRTPPAGAKTAQAQEQTRIALECVGALRAAVAPRAWPALDGLRASGERFGKRGWSQAAALAGAAADSLKEGPAGPSLVQRLAGVIEAAEAARGLEQQWLGVEAAVAALAKTGDPVAAKFGPWAAGLLGGAAGSGMDDPVEGLRECAERLSEAGDLARDLAAFVGEGAAWESVDAQSFREGGRVHAEVAAGRTVDAAVFRDWLFQAPSFGALDPALDPRRQWADRVPAELTRAGELAGRLGSAADAADTARLADLRKRAGELAGMRWAQKTRAAIEGGAERIESESAALRRSLERALAAADAEAARSFAEAAERLRGRAEVTGSAALNAAWVRCRNALISELEAGGDARALQRRAGEIEAAVAGIDAAVPAADVGAGGAGGAWLAPLRAAAGSERERILFDAAAALAPGADLASKAAERSKAAAATMTALVAGLSEVATALATLESQLNLGAGLTEQVAGAPTVEALAARVRESTTRHGPAAVEAAAGVLARADALAAIARGTDTGALRRLVEQARADRPEEAIGAWRRLGEVGWPGSAEDLAAEVGARAVLGRVLESLPEQRRGALAAEIAAELPRRWLRAAAALKKPADLDAALALRDECGVQVGAIEPAGLRFNAMAHDLRHALMSGTVADDEARAALRNFIGACGPLSAALSPAQREAVTALEPLVAEDGAARVDPATLGPGSVAGWTGKAGDGGRSVTFTSGGGSGSVSLRFWLVESPAGRAYVQDTELSVGQAAAIIATRRAWADLRSFVPAFSDAADPRLGPCGWEWEERAGVRIMKPAAAWLKPAPGLLGRGGAATADLYPPGLDPGAPSADHPLQQFPPDAAAFVASLAGCRLPTSSEWKVAAAAAGAADGAGASTNLRDATWRRQHAHVDAARRAGKKPQWPDEGAFWPAGDQSDRKGRAATAVDADDGVLWFAPAASAGGARFAHVRGNVAEYVFDEPAALSGLATPEVEAVRGLLREHAAKLGVIGGSALSAPELATDAPLPMEFEEALDVGYADVGLRLAFDADGRGTGRRSVAARAAELVGPEVYILPR